MTIRSNITVIKNHIVPLLGRRAVADVTTADVDDLKRAIREGRTGRDELAEGSGKRIIVKGGLNAANRSIAVLSKAFNLSERSGWRPRGSNPCRGIDKYRAPKRERFLSAEELARLGAVLADAEAKGTAPPQVIACIRLLLFTGARLGEILTLQWPHIDFERACLNLPDSKTGAKVVHLNAPALALLTGLPRHDGNFHLLPGEREIRHLAASQASLALER